MNKRNNMINSKTVVSEILFDVLKLDKDVMNVRTQQMIFNNIPTDTPTNDKTNNTINECPCPIDHSHDNIANGITVSVTDSAITYADKTIEDVKFEIDEWYMLSQNNCCQLVKIIHPDTQKPYLIYY